MKNLKNNHEVAHAFANSTYTEGKGSNFFFDETGLYSYGRHFRVAKHAVNDNGQTAVLFTTSNYSISTAKHVSYARNAVWGNIIFCPSPGSRHIDNFNLWVKEIEGLASSLKSARKPERYLNSIAGISAQITKYVEFFNITIPANVTALMNITNSAEYEAFTDKRADYEKQAAEARQKELKKDLNKQLAKWRNFETSYISIKNGFDFLRFNADKNRVETSQRVEIPVLIAKEFYTYVLNTVSAGGCTN